MLTVAQLVGQLDINDGPWNAKMRSAQGDVEKSKGWLGGLSGVAKGVGLGLLGAGVAAATMGLKTAAAGQQSQIAFETMLGSADKAKSFLGDLSQFAAATPFEMPGLVAAARQLVGVGESADAVIPTLTAWGDTAGALGLNQDQFNRAILAVTQSMGKGKVQAEEMMQITEAGIPIWPLLAKAMGKTIPELQAMAQKGELLSSDVFPLLEKQMGKDYGGAMAKQSKTLSGVWSTLMDTINMGLAKVLTPLLPMLTKLIPKGAEILGQVFDGLSGSIETVMGWFHGAGDAGSGLASTWSTVFAAVRGFITDNLATFQAWWGSIQGIFTGLRDLVVAIWGRITEFWADHGQVILDSVQTVWGFIKTIISSALAVIQGVIRAAIAVVTGDWSGAWEAIKSVLAAVWDGIKAIIGLAWEVIKTTIGTALSAVWDIVVGKFGEITDWLSGLPKRFADSVVALWDWIWERADDIKSKVITAISDLWTWIREELPGILATAGSKVFEWIIGVAKQAAIDAWNALVSFFGGPGRQAAAGAVLPPRGGDAGRLGQQAGSAESRMFGGQSDGGRSGFGQLPVWGGTIQIHYPIGEPTEQSIGRAIDMALATA
jgi:tape measure domain-containing protein